MAQVRVRQSAIADLMRRSQPQRALQAVAKTLQAEAEAATPYAVGSVHTHAAERYSIRPARDGWQIVNNDPFFHLIEWGSVNNPPYGPMRSAILRLGLRYFDPGPA